VRLYDDTNQEEDVRVTFFRDSASWCPYCQKVWMTLEEKRIPYRVEKINMRCYGEKPASFARIQPGGQIPVAIIDGRTYGQSNEIMYAVEELFPSHKSLRPPKGKEGTAQELLRLERRIFSAWMSWLTGSGNGAQRQADFCSVLSEVESALKQSGGPFFMGKDVTLVDFMFAPFLERMAASLLFFKGFTMRAPPSTPTDYPYLNRWFDGMETLESYRLTKSDYYTHCWDLPPQLGGCTYEAAGEPYEQAINGERSLDGTRGSWELPLQPHNGGVEPDWSWAGDEDAAKREAVERLSANHEAIVAFAARGAGRKGMPPYSAVLADPNAVPNENVKNGVSAVLQIVSMALLQGVKQHEPGMTKMADAILQEGGREYADGIVASLTYLRDRVGVPRDMRLPAARQLRAHLNWAIGKVLSAQGKGIKKA
jgi:glutathione S-transferase